MFTFNKIYTMAWFSVNVYHHIVPPKGQEDRLKSISDKLDYLTLKINEMATKQERFDSLLEKLNVTTNNIAADYQKLLDEVRNGTVSDESLTRAEENITKLEGIAASVENPLPGEELPHEEGGENTNNGGANAGNA
jgi:hypothetical protein